MKDSLYKSLALHLVVFLIFLVDLPMFWHDSTAMRQVPIIVDLNKVKISEMTNLPPKAKIGKEDKAASTVKRKVENYTAPEPKEEPKKEAEKKEQPKQKEKPKAVVEETEKPKNDYLVTKEEKKAETKKRKEKVVPVQQRRPKPKTKPKPQAKKTPELVNPLKSLLASVDEMERNLGPEDSEAVVKEGTQVQNMGIEGGTGGNYFSELSISEMDALAGRLRACWNLDPGAMGIEDMIIEIRATLNQDGSVRNVEILDMARYNSDNFFRSVADSARRAVYICQPYNILAEKYPDKYDKWQTMLLKFNPLNKQIN